VGQVFSQLLWLGKPNLSISPLTPLLYGCFKSVTSRWTGVAMRIKTSLTDKNQNLSLTHLVLFALRCVIAFRFGLWSRPSPWNFTTTGITVQVTVKLLGRESANGN
jgi:hypothetical protein